MDQSDVTNLIVESAEKILSDFCDKKLLDQCEAGGFAKELWAVSYTHLTLPTKA